MIAQLVVTYQERWPECHLLQDKSVEVMSVSKRLVAPQAKAIYADLQKVTTVPWFVIAVIHEREASQGWWANIANGEPWNRITRKVPRGRGPFSNFRSAAIDALTKTPLYTLKTVNSWTDWSPGGSLTLLEMYNGFGYELYHHENSPYIWAATNFEERGKYVTDGVYDPRVWDTQLGCAAMLKGMQQLDPSIFAEGGSDV